MKEKQMINQEFVNRLSFDDDEISTIGKTNTDIKQVIVVRKDLGMRKGKMIAQGAHASMKVLIDNMESREVLSPCIDSHKKNFSGLILDINDPLNIWLFNGSFKKIYVYVNSEEELLDIYNKADIKYKSLIQDSGLTEFKGIPTYTCCAIGPDYSEVIDKITGHLKLL